MTGIGSYPGGPKRREDGGETIGEERRAGSARLDRAEDIEARITDGREDLRRRRRTKRILSGLLAAAVVAAGLGILIGYQAHKSSEAITAERNGESQPKGGFDPLFQTNRVLDELWKMEMKQRQQNRP